MKREQVDPTVGGGGGRPPKRPRGRLPGSRKPPDSASDLKVHIVHIAQGEDVRHKISSLAQMGPRKINVLSAQGYVSTVTIRNPRSTCDVTYQGYFGIMTLTGFFSRDQNEGSRDTLIATLADDQVFGGTVTGPMIAAGPIQVTLLSFLGGQTSISGSQLRNDPGPNSSNARPSAAPVANILHGDQASTPSTGNSLSQPSIDQPRHRG